MIRKILIVCLLIPIVACVPSSSSKRPKPATPIQGQSGIMIPQYGMTIGAKYEPELDSLVPGYKVITVALTNNSLEQIRMDSINDKWIVQMAAGKKITAINSLRFKDYQKWAGLSPKIRELIDYPLAVPIGFTQTFDLFFKGASPKGKPDLEGFRSIAYFNANLGMTFEIISND